MTPAPEEQAPRRTDMEAKHTPAPMVRCDCRKDHGGFASRCRRAIDWDPSPTAPIYCEDCRHHCRDEPELSGNDVADAAEIAHVISAEAVSDYLIQKSHSYSDKAERAAKCGDMENASSLQDIADGYMETSREVDDARAALAKAGGA